MTAKLALIVAVADNGIIGRDNQLPWHIPEDLRWFKENTMGKPMIMGRKTFESLGRVLPGRPHIIVTRDPSYAHEGVHVAHSLDAAEAMAQKLAEEMDSEEIMVIGGADIYVQMLPKAEKLYRTLVELSPDGDASFPELGKEWRVTYEQKNMSNETNFSFQVVENAL